MRAKPAKLLKFHPSATGTQRTHLFRPRLVGRILLILVYPIKENDAPLCHVPVPGPVGRVHPCDNRTTLWHLTAR